MQTVTVVAMIFLLRLTAINGTRQLEFSNNMYQQTLIMGDDLIAVTLLLCGVLQAATQPRLPMSSEVGQMVLVDWLLGRPAK